MNILAMDTTTKKANVSLLFNNLLYSNSIDNEITHSEKFLPLVDKTLKDANAKLKAIDIFAVTTGPGSFTGIRIGLASVKAFSKVYNKKIFAITSLEVLAYTKIDKNINNQYIIALMDAKNSRAYYTIYKVDYINDIPRLSNVIPYYNDTVELINKKINEYFSNIFNFNITITGDITEEYFNLLNIPTNNVTFNRAVLNSDTIIQIINNEVANNNLYTSKYLKDYLTLDASYIRGSEAERTKYGESK